MADAQKRGTYEELLQNKIAVAHDKYSKEGGGEACGDERENSEHIPKMGMAVLQKQNMRTKIVLETCEEIDEEVVCERGDSGRYKRLDIVEGGAMRNTWDEYFEK